MISAWRKDKYEVGEFDVDNSLDALLLTMAEMHQSIAVTSEPASSQIPSAALVDGIRPDGSPRNDDASEEEAIIMESKYPPAFLLCTGLCLTFFATSVVDSAFGDLTAMLMIALLILMEREQLRSYHLALIGVLGFLCTFITPQELFFISIIGLACYVAIQKEGLLYWLDEEQVNSIINMNLIDLLEVPFSGDPKNDKEKSKDPTQQLTAMKKFTSFLTRDGFLFASLPSFVRYALLPASRREEYERSRRRLIEDLRKEQNRSTTEKVTGTIAKTIEKVEESVTDRLSKDVAWLSSRVQELEASVHRHPIIWWIETITKRTRRNSDPNGSKQVSENRTNWSRVGIFLLAASAFIMVGSGLRILQLNHWNILLKKNGKHVGMSSIRTSSH